MFITMISTFLVGFIHGFANRLDGRSLFKFSQLQLTPANKGIPTPEDEAEARKALNDAMNALSNITLPSGKNFTSVTLNFRASKKEKIIFPDKVVAAKYLSLPAEQYNILNDKIVTRSEDDPSSFLLTFPMREFSSALEYLLKTDAYKWMSFYDMVTTVKVSPDPTNRLIAFDSGTFYLANTTSAPPSSTTTTSSDITESMIEYQVVKTKDNTFGSTKLTTQMIGSNRDVPTWFRWTGNGKPVAKNAAGNIDIQPHDSTDELIPWAFQPYFRSHMTWESDDSPIVKSKSFFSRLIPTGNNRNLTGNERMVDLNVEVGATISFTPDTSAGKVLLLGGRLAQAAVEKVINAVLGVMLRTNVKAFGESLVRDCQRRFGMTAEEITKMDQEEAKKRAKLALQMNDLSQEILDKISLSNKNNGKQS